MATTRTARTETSAQTNTSARTETARTRTAPRSQATELPDPATLAGQIRAAVLGVPGVAGLPDSTGGVQVATQFAGGKIAGIRLGDPIEVHITIEPVPIGPLSAQVREAVLAVLGRFGQSPTVEVVVDDINLTVDDIKLTVPVTNDGRS